MKVNEKDLPNKTYQAQNQKQEEEEDVRKLISVEIC